MADPRLKYVCRVCGQTDIGATVAGRLRSHKTPPQFDAYTPKCENSGSLVGELPPEPPCVDIPPEPVSFVTCSSASTTSPEPSTATPRRTPDTLTTRSPVTATTPAGFGAPRPPTTQAVEFDQPAPAPTPVFDQPSRSAQRGARTNAAVKPMTPLGAEIAARLKEMFHGFTNRQERSQQATMGPSEIGTPCDRRIALNLLQYPTVNPGGDGWASFVGTHMHEGLEEMLKWADAGSGRYATEQRLTFPSRHVPKGTTDYIDRTLMLVGDHKGMGQWSLDKLKTSGPSVTYRIQAHVYGYGAKLRGENIKHVAIIGWPRDKGNLDDLYVWTEPYDPKIARDALKRVDDIAGMVLPEGPSEPGAPMPPTHDPYALPMDNDDCRYCPFYLPGAGTSEGGVCSGRN